MDKRRKVPLSGSACLLMRVLYEADHLLTVKQALVAVAAIGSELRRETARDALNGLVLRGYADRRRAEPDGTTGVRPFLYTLTAAGVREMESRSAALSGRS